MSVRPGALLRLSCLVEEWFHPFYGLDSSFLTEDAEKNLLVALSQVLKRINQWKHEIISEEVLVEDSCFDTESLVAATPRSNFLAKIITNLVLLLEIKNQYAEHLIGNTLFAIFEFLLMTDDSWDDFLELMCYCVELMVGNCSGPLLEPVTSKVTASPCDLSNAKSLLKLKLNHASLSAAAVLFQVLHKVQKYLKKDSDETLAAYLDYVRTLVSSLPADIFKCAVDRHTESQQHSGVEAVYRTEMAGLGEATVFVGTFIQLLCSLVAESCFVRAGDGYSPFACKVIDLIPHLASWCLPKSQSCISFRVSYYFRHKLLLLMVKISSSHLEKTIIVTWIHLLHKNFEDLLYEPIYGVGLDADDHDGFLEGSPFCSSVFTSEKPITTSRHLQRLAVFVFLKCSLNLMSTSDELLPVKESVNQNSIINESLSVDHVVRSLGTEKLHEWFLAHAPADIFVKMEMYHEWCMQFSLCFLRLYIHEDDILFEVLLLLLCVPFHPCCQATDDESRLPLKHLVILLAFELFNPMTLFHLFLSEIFYDHQVLLDYLISKDTGPKCAEYLLRSLRIIFNSWKSFVEFPGVECHFRSSCKRRKVLVESNDLMRGEESPEKLIISAHEVNQNNGFTNKLNCQRNSSPPHIGVRRCLASLRRSIDSLNRKKLFPYNPKVLLQRLTRFEELCAQE